MALFSFSDVFALFGAAWLAARMGLTGFVTAIILMATMQQTVYAGTVNPIRALGWKEHDFGLEPAAKPLDYIASGARDPVARALLVGSISIPRSRVWPLKARPMT